MLDLYHSSSGGLTDTGRNPGCFSPLQGRSPRLRRIVAAVAFLLLGVASYLLGLASHAQEGGTALLLDVKGPIGPAASDHVERGLTKAREQDARLVILRLDTPGGLDSSMRAIIQEILASPIPVASFVAPSGAHAASAGTYILYASHIAAMAPGTNLGAATPVAIGLPMPKPPGREAGEEGPEEDAKAPAEDDAPPTMADKAVSDAVAYIRSLAQMRDRNADWAEKAVREAASLPAEEALAEGVIDLIASDVPDLIAKLDGRSIKIFETTRTLETAGLRIVMVEPDWRTEFLSIITNPNVAYVLMLVGIYGLLIEFYNPGLILPGVTGAISLLLALYALHILPINYAGLALTLLGLGLMVAEALVPSFGFLGIGGVAAFVVGSVMLLDTDVPGFGISWLLIGSIALVSGGIFVLVMMLFMRSRRRAVVSGPEEMVGSTGEVLEWDGQGGRVRVHGEVWQARARKALQPGAGVRVKDLDGLTLVVEPLSKRR